MSLLLKNELRLRLGPQRASAALWRAGWRTRCVATAAVSGANEALLDLALDALLAQGHALPAQATLSVDDEFLYFATLSAAGPWKQAEQDAYAHFAELLDEEALEVRVRLAAHGRLWLASALPTRLLESWRDTLARRDILLRGVGATLFEDLWEARADLQHPHCIAAVLRQEGVTLLSLERGGITDIAWERCDTSDAALLGARVRAYRSRQGQDGSDGDGSGSGSGDAEGAADWPVMVVRRAGDDRANAGTWPESGGALPQLTGAGE